MVEEGKKGFWETNIIHVEPNKFLFRGYRIDDLVGRVSYAEMLYMMITGELPSHDAGRLLEAALVAGCDHGASSPAVAAARMAATCGVTLNCAIATGINMLGDIHGGAVEQGMKMYYEIAEQSEKAGLPYADKIREVVQQYKADKRYMPGFGHGTHTDDPRVRRLFEVAGEVKANGSINGKYVEIARTVEQTLFDINHKLIALNIDGAVAAISCEVGLPWQVGKGIFASRGRLGSPLMRSRNPSAATGSKL